MHIAFLTPSLEVGGYERVVVNYANALAGLGHRVTIVAGHRGGPLEEHLHAQISVVVLGRRARLWLWPLARFLRQQNPDALYAGFRAYNSLAVVARIISGSSTQIVASQHGFETQRASTTKLLARAIKRADVIVANSPAVADAEAADLGIERDSIRVLNNPVIPIEKAPRPKKETSRPPKEPNEVRIVVVGRLAADKRMDIALRILHGVLVRNRARMLILGDGPEAGALAQLADDLGVRDRVHFAGVVADTTAHLRGCDILLHTAEAEGFGNVIVEALFENIPVVCTSCSGPPYIIKHDQYGVEIGRADDPLTVQRGISAVEDIALGRKRFEGLRDRASEFGIQAASRQLLEVLEKRG